jgi:hypothetical protein
MREQDDQLNEEITEEPVIATGIDLDPEDEPVMELPENEIDENEELNELFLGER